MFKKGINSLQLHMQYSGIFISVKREMKNCIIFAQTVGTLYNREEYPQFMF